MAATRREHSRHLCLTCALRRARNYTIDDSQWATSALELSDGWNMLRVNGSDQWIGKFQVQVKEMRTVLNQFWNQSVSWTNKEGSWTKLSFVGTDIWAYGIAGPQYGSLRINLDNQDSEIHSLTQETVDYHTLLFEAHGLEDSEHSLTFTNLGYIEDENEKGDTSGGGSGNGSGGRMGFDYAVIQSAAFWAADQSSSVSPSKSTRASVSTNSQTSAPAPEQQQQQEQEQDQPISTTTSPSLPLASDTAALAAHAEAQANANASAAAASASAEAAMTALLPTQYSASQLASLREQYVFEWNPAACFVVVFASLVCLIFGLAGLHVLVRRWVEHKTGGGFRRSRRSSDQDQPVDRDRQQGISPGSDRSICIEDWKTPAYQLGPRDAELGTGVRREKRRPATRVLQALSSRKIGLPLERQRAEGESMDAEERSRGGSFLPEGL
ncbi:hypothetical protein I316_04940 [Kwoniella heveanensis BCC8398]|uniref:Uncharacterized protein n=1 Tax=Kwoniella heveanensis BCC8398 TaxID=1296120 RepID=A0A1B9GR18_9TREE|nr:hypothetical protein I316_04940 [Kwoniella heveanensis BCC8398]